MMKQIALDYLLKNEPLHIDMLETMRHERYQLVYASDKGVLLFNETAQIYMLTTEDLNLGEELIKQHLKAGTGIVIHQREWEPIVRRYFKVSERLECYQEIFPKTELMTLPGQLEIRAMTDTKKVCQYYSHDSDPEYIQEIILGGWMFGLYENEALAGFIGRHTDGSMGLLEVLPEYKRKHYATYLLNYMCVQYQKRGWTAYSQVEIQNEASLHLHMKAGAIKSDTAIIWLM